MSVWIWEAGIFSGEFWSLPDGRYKLGARAIERRDFHRYNLWAAVILGGRNSERQIRLQCLLGLATLGLATILGLVTRNLVFLEDQYINSTLGLATSIVSTKTGH